MTYFTDDMWIIGFDDRSQLHESTIKEIDEDLVRVVVDRRPDLSGWWLLSKIQLVKKLRGSE